MDKATNGTYPSSEVTANGGRGLSKSTGTIYQYTVDGDNYYLSATSTAAGSSASYISSVTGTVMDGVWSEHLAPGQSPWQRVAVGDYHACGIGSNGLGYCWGASNRIGNNTGAGSLVPTPIYTSGPLNGKTLVDIRASQDHTCALTSEGLAYCWGSNNQGWLGNNTTSGPDSPTSLYMTGAFNGLTIKKIASQYYHGCVVASDDNVYCFGRNVEGQLGNGNNTQSNAPVAVDRSGVLSGKTVKMIADGRSYGHTCVIASDNKGYCWGWNYAGQLGNSSAVDSNVPVAVNMTGVLSGKTLKTIVSGQGHTCAIATDDLLYCWGNYAVGSSTSPAAVTTGLLSGKTFTFLAAGENSTCAIASSGSAYCWGQNNGGQFGDGTTTGGNPTAVDMTGALSGKTLRSIATCSTHTCAVASDNKAYCWGQNNAGQLGDNSTSVSLVPVATTTLP